MVPDGIRSVHGTIQLERSLLSQLPTGRNLLNQKVSAAVRVLPSKTMTGSPQLHKRLAYLKNSLRV